MKAWYSLYLLIHLYILTCSDFECVDSKTTLGPYPVSKASFHLLIIKQFHLRFGSPNYIYLGYLALIVRDERSIYADKEW